MRIIEDMLLIRVIIYLIVLIALLLGNIYIKVCLKHNSVTKGIHITSALMGAFVFCFYMQDVIIELEFEKIYQQIATVSLAAGLASALITISLMLKARITQGKSLIFNPDLSEIITELEDLVLIYDYKGMLIKKNNRTIEIGIGEAQEHDLQSIIIELSCIAITNKDKIMLEIESGFKSIFSFGIMSNSNVYYKVTIAPLKDDRINNLGYIITFHDITEEKNLLEEINRQNELLSEANEKLEQYVKVANILENEKERLKLLEGINRELIARIEDVIENIHLLQNSEFSDFQSYQARIKELTKELRNIFQTIRESVKAIATEQTKL